jgi:DNA-directed RNA polymerase specialized sigma24 family protein
VNDLDLGSLLRQAAGGDWRSWDALVDRFAGLVWAIARGHGLNQADAAEISRTTWMRLAENLDFISAPERLGVWLATNALRECLRLMRQREGCTSAEQLTESTCGDRALEMTDDLAKRGRGAALWSAFEALAPDCKALLRVLLADPPLSHAELSEVFEMPIGSIGPVRARCLDRLGDRAALHPLHSQGRHAVAGTTKGRVS